MKTLVGSLLVLFVACAPAPNAGSSSQSSGASSGDVVVARTVGFTTLGSPNNRASGRVEVALQADGKLRTVIRLSGLAAGSKHAAHIHSGSCSDPGAIIFALSEVSADATGSAISSSSVDNSRMPRSAYVMVHERPSSAETGPGSGIVCATIR